MATPLLLPPTAAQPLGYSRASLGAVANPFALVLTAAKVAQVSNIQADTAKKNNENLSETVRRELNLVQIENARQSLENLAAQKDLTDAQRAEIQNVSNGLTVLMPPLLPRRNPVSSPRRNVSSFW